MLPPHPATVARPKARPFGAVQRSSELDRTDLAQVLGAASSFKAFEQLALKEKEKTTLAQQYVKLYEQLAPPKTSDPGEALAIIASLLEGSLNWAKPGMNSFSMVMVKPSEEDFLSLLVGMKTMNCWESVLFIGFLAKQIGIKEISTLRLYSSGDQVEIADILSQQPDTIWKDLGFYDKLTEPVAIEKKTLIPAGNLVFYVPLDEGNAEYCPGVGEVGELLFDKLDKTRNSGELYKEMILAGYLSPVAKKKATVVPQKVAADVEVYRKTQTGKSDTGIFGVLKNNKDKYNTLMTVIVKRYDEILYHQKLPRPYPGHVALSLGDGRCASLWDNPALSLSLVDIGAFKNNHLYHRKPIWLK